MSKIRVLGDLDCNLRERREISVCSRDDLLIARGGAFEVHCSVTARRNSTNVYAGWPMFTTIVSHGVGAGILGFVHVHVPLSLVLVQNAHLKRDGRIYDGFVAVDDIIVVNHRFVVTFPYNGEVVFDHPFGILLRGSQNRIGGS